MFRIFKADTKKSFLCRMTVILAALYMASLLLAFIYSSVSNNIVYMYSALMYVLEIGLELLDIAVYAVAFGFFVFAAQQYGFANSIPFFVSYAALTAARRLLSLVLELLFAGAIDASDFVSIGVYFVLDMLTLGVVLVIVAYEFGKYGKYLNEWNKAQRDRGKEQLPPALYPFEKLYGRTNPLQVCALKIGILLSSAKILSRIIFDVFYGTPTSLSEALIMVVYYLSDILIGLLIYAAMLWIFSRLYKGQESEK